MNFELIASIVNRLSNSAVVGAYALAMRGYVRQTADFDLMTTDRAALHEGYWNDLRDAGAQVVVRVGDYDDPLGGLVRIEKDGTDVDVIVARYRWQKDLLERAEEISINGVLLKVPSPADLILLKLAAGGYTDMQDVAGLLSVAGTETVITAVSDALADLPPEMTARWRDVLSRI